MSIFHLRSEDVLRLAALAPPFAVRLHEDGMEAAAYRILLLVVAGGLFHGWAALFARCSGRPAGAGLLPAAMAFVLLLPGPVAWTGAILAVSFGAVFGREVFGGKAVLSPAAIGLAFAIFSFPEGGFEIRGILASEPDPLFALSCLPGAVVLAWKGALCWRCAVGALIGALSAAFFAEVSAPWEHLGMGAFVAGVVFLAAEPHSTPRCEGAQWLQGLLVGALVILIRLGNPAQPDGVIFAALLAGLFAPLLDRIPIWRRHHG